MSTTFLKKIFLSLGAVLVSSQVLAMEDPVAVQELGANEDLQGKKDRKTTDDLDKRITKLETQMNQVSTETALGTYGAKYGSANPNVESGVFMYGDLLYWHVYEGSTYNYTQGIQNSAVTLSSGGGGKAGPSINSESNSDDIQEDARHVNFRWDFGFKIGVGYQLPHDEWDASAEFTYFRTKGSDTQSGFLPIIQGADHFPTNDTARLSANNGAIKSTDTEWKLDYYNINFILGRNFFISKSLSLHPFAGIQTTWIWQHLSLDSLITENNGIGLTSGRDLGASNSFTNEILTNSRKNRFWGAGPRFGFDTKWYFNKSVGLYGTVAGGIMWGEFGVTRKLLLDAQSITVQGGVLIPVTETDTLVSYKIVYHPHRIVANAQLDLGISWELYFTSSDSHLEVRAGYENQYWWRQNYIGTDTLSTPDDLGFHGALVEAKFDF